MLSYMFDCLSLQTSPARSRVKETFAPFSLQPRIANQKLLQKRLGGEDEVTDHPVAFAFWHNQDNDDLKLPDVCRDGLQSAICKGGFKVFLLTYQKLENLPEGTVVANADDFLED